MSYAERFLDGYLDAWRTNDHDSIRALFTADATYRSSARDLEPAEGIDEIVARWDAERDEPGTWSYSGAVDLQTETSAVIRGITRTPRDRSRARTRMCGSSGSLRMAGPPSFRTGGSSGKAETAPARWVRLALRA